MSMSIQFDQEFYNNIKEKKERNITFNANSSLSLTSTVNSLNQSFLLSKLTFNLSKGHYYFIYEILKTKQEKLQMMGIEADPNEQASLNQNWLQTEKDQMSKKFLDGKTCLILCCFIKELEWSITLAKLLLDKGALLTKKDNINGCYPIHYACALLKPELIELFIRKSDFDCDFLDFNHNTPLIYFMVAFSLYLNKLWSPITSYKNSKKAIIRRKTFVGNCVKCLNDESFADNANDNEVNEFNDEFVTKIINSLKVYLGHLKRFRIKVNAINRFGYSLLDIYSYIIASNKNLDNHPFFILIQRAAIESDINQITDANFKMNSALTTLTKNDKISNLKQTNSFKSSSYKCGSIIDSILKEAPPTTIRIYLELILKKNLLINLNEMQFPRVITHEKIVDKDLVFLFLEKQINDCRSLTITNDFNKSTNPTKIEKEKTIKDDWRQKLSQCYHYLEMDQTKSLRRSVLKPESSENIISLLEVIKKKSQLPQINEKNEGTLASRISRKK